MALAETFGLNVAGGPERDLDLSLTKTRQASGGTTTRQ
jgi:hypothetical protein